MPKWNPSKLEDLDLERDIIVRYFNANTKSKLSFCNTRDYHLHPFRKYALPSEQEILETMTTEKLQTVKETVDWFIRNRNRKFGVRQKVEDTLHRFTSQIKL